MGDHLVCEPGPWLNPAQALCPVTAASATDSSYRKLDEDIESPQTRIVPDSPGFLVMDVKAWLPTSRAHRQPHGLKLKEQTGNRMILFNVPVLDPVAGIHAFDQGDLSAELLSGCGYNLGHGVPCPCDWFWRT